MHQTLDEAFEGAGRYQEALVEKSLLRVTSTGRCEMHELVRQYAEARLLGEPLRESERVQDRHCTY